MQRSWRPRGRRRRHAAGRLVLVFISAGAVATGSAIAVALPGVSSKPASSHTPVAAHATDATSNAASSPTAASHRLLKARGLEFAGLVQDTNGPCGRDFRLAHTTGKPLCSPGPDPAPHDLDVSQYRSTADLLAAGVVTSPAHGGSVQCIGDGVSGARVQAIYAVASDVADRFGQLAPSIATWAGQVDGVFSQSASESGGDRHVRFVTNPDCSLNIKHVVLSPTGDDSFDNMVTELQQLGYAKASTKYLVWMDANVYCGIGNIISDDSAAATNANNTMTDYARVDNGCWGRTDHLSEAHELMHTLGGVQLSAPHATPNHHCTDEYDAMCYVDGSGVTLSYPCAVGHEWLFDCNDDDYFDTNPSPGSYLATHWDTARSQFLQDPGSGSSTTTTTAATTTTTTRATTTTTAAPVTTTTTTTAGSSIQTTTFSGSVSSKRSKQRFSVTVGTGTASDALQFSGNGKSKSSGSLTLTVYAANGAVVLNTTGPSVLRQSVYLAAGTYTWEVSGSTSASFSLGVTYRA